jgi:4-amino-4-deoxy-L-arabinose transferase-like glycosyltransferase
VGTSRPTAWTALAVLAGVFAAGWFFVSATRNVPVMDDWVYASSVERLLNTGHLAISDYSSIYPIAQVLWGALFALAGGFSFGALRLSTVVLAVIGCQAIFLTLRELRVDPAVALLAALTVALSPVYFALSFTFMTDVPFVALAAVTLFFNVSAIARRDAGRLWWGTLAGVLAFLIRPIGIVLPIAAMAGIGMDRASWSGRRPLVAPLVAVALMATMWWALPHLFGRLPVADARVVGMQYLAAVPLARYAWWNFNVFIIAAFPLAPLLLGVMNTRRHAALAMAGACVLALCSWLAFRQLATPLPQWQTWSLQDISTRGGLLGGNLAPSAWSVRVMPAVSALGLLVAACLGGGVIAALRRRRDGDAVLFIYALLQVVLFSLLWFFDDRYYIVLTPALAYLGAAALGGARRRRVSSVALPALALWAFVSFTGTRDMIVTNDTVARVERELEAQGIPAADIDAGYASNGWRLYAHPENLHAHADPHDSVPFITSDGSAPYRIVNAPDGDEILRVVSLPAAMWQVSDRIYVVHQRGR